MSQVRWCDKCGTVFPTNQEGWMGGQVSKVIRQNGELKSVTEPVDMCAMCANPNTSQEAIVAELTNQPGYQP